MTGFYSLDRLRLSDANPRRTAPSPEEIEALAGSIASVGLLQNLIGYLDPTDDPASPDHGVVWITGGGRRLLALQRLQADMSDTLQIPVLIERDLAHARTAALAENEVRAQMNPVDRFRAYLEQARDGVPIAAIARRFATDAPAVERILALQRVAEPILEALAGDQISLDQARAFTVTDDHQAQVTVFNRMRAGYDDEPHQIRHALKKNSINAEREASFLFVGERAYVEAGGRLTRDLFSTSIWIEDPDILARVRDEALDAVAESLLRDGWKWASSVPVNTWDYDRLEPTQYEFSEAEAQEMGDLQTRQELVGDETEVDPETGEVLRALTDAECVRLAELEALEDLEDFSADQMAVAGCALRVGYNGKLVVSRGLVKREDRQAALDTDVLPPHVAAAVRRDLGLEEAEAAEAGADAAPGDAETPAPEEPGVKPLNQQIVHDLSCLRATIVGAALTDSVELALDLLAWTLSDRRLRVRNVLEGDLSSTRRLGMDDFGFQPPAALVAGPRRSEELDPLGFAAFRALGRAHRNAVLAAAIGQAVTSRRLDTLAEVEAEARLDLRRNWTPGPTLFERMTIPQILAVYEEIAGVTMASDHIGAVVGMIRKPDAVRIICAAFADPAKAFKGRPEAVARTKAWLPEPMRACRTDADALSAAVQAAAAASPELPTLPAPEPSPEPSSARPATATDRTAPAAPDQAPIAAAAPRKGGRRKKPASPASVAAE